MPREYDIRIVTTEDTEEQAVSKAKKILTEMNKKDVLIEKMGGIVGRNHFQSILSEGACEENMDIKTRAKNGKVFVIILLSPSFARDELVEGPVEEQYKVFLKALAHHPRISDVELRRK